MLRVEAAMGIEPPQKLQWRYYRNSCRDAERYVTSQVEFYWKRDKSLAPKLIRMLYADCFVTGCDASILLDGPYSEKTAPQSAGFLGFPMVVIDKIKQILEERCPGVVSCADILNFAARDAAHLAGGPSYPVLAGRRDGMSSSAASLHRGLAIQFHKTGKPDPSMDSSFLAQMREQCPPNSKNQVYLDPDSGSSYSFSKSFYSRVLNHRAILGIDQQIAANNDSSQIAQQYDGSFEDFRKRFALSMSRMGNIKVLTGNQGEIRKNCRVVNRK
ncbi:hypothetical protein ACJRO7_000115 [Eucalyptus globulus]|uniref:peroxidase n=1 Tax=Eucalyptus globulus TaxID=34317 RepID=A0ABD3LMH1_EUCGL